MKYFAFHPEVNAYCTANQNAVTACLKSKQLLRFGFEPHIVQLTSEFIHRILKQSNQAVVTQVSLTRLLT